MKQPNITFAFAADVPMRDVEDTLRLALLAAQALHGEDQVALHARTHVNLTSRTCAIGTGSDVGQTLALVFRCYARREYGQDAFVDEVVGTLTAGVAP